MKYETSPIFLLDILIDSSFLKFLFKFLPSKIAVNFPKLKFIEEINSLSPSPEIIDLVNCSGKENKIDCLLLVFDLYLIICEFNIKFSHT